jgi:RNA polymerase sigma-70 factor, ECF subfamily
MQHYGGPPRATDMPHPDPGGFTEFYQVNFHRIATQLYAYLGDHSEAQDLTQEAFCRLLDRWSAIRHYNDPVAWVRKVAWNLATSRLRRVKVALRYLSRQREEHAEGPTPDRVALFQALATLPIAQRRAVVLYYLGHLSTSEIAAQEGVAEGTVRSQLTRARSQLVAYFHEPKGVELDVQAFHR